MKVERTQPATNILPNKTTYTHAYTSNTIYTKVHTRNGVNVTRHAVVMNSRRVVNIVNMAARVTCTQPLNNFAACIETRPTSAYPTMPSTLCCHCSCLMMF